MLVWMDLEMTGLDPTSDVIVEIATIVTDDDLAVVAEGPDLVIHQPDEMLDKMIDIVRDMHSKSGLRKAIEESTVTLEEAGKATVEFIKAHVDDPGNTPLCGNSIGVDRRFLAAYLPEIEDLLHYRSIDVSTLKELGRRWYPALMGGAPKKESSHRALDDIRESINELRFYRSTLFRPPEPSPVVFEPAPPIPQP